mgnify:CR=1 FL=1
MLAVLYLILACVLGDAVCRRFFTFASLGHRIAAALLSGLLVSSWATYTFAYIFSSTGAPMLWGNAVFFAVALVAVILLKWRPGLGKDTPPAATEFVRWDWILVAVFTAVGIWMMFSTFSATGDRLQIGNHQWSDFGSNVSVMRSFSVGLNFPTEYPHFSGDRIRYHFLFYFLAGNVEYLGLNPAWANNVVSILTLVAMLMLVMTLGSVLFGSRIAGRIGSILFFFHGSLAYIPFFKSMPTWSDALSKIWEMRGFLPSGLPYRGEDWGVWTQVVYLNQRHLASSIGLLLLVLIFLLIRSKNVSSKPKPLRAAAKKQFTDKTGDSVPVEWNTEEIEISAEKTVVEDVEDPLTQLSLDEARELAGDEVEVGDMLLIPLNRQDMGRIAAQTAKQIPEVDDLDRPPDGLSSDPPAVNYIATPAAANFERFAPYVFAGCLLGLMPMWNGAVFTGAAAVMAVLLIFLPIRKEMLVMGIVSGLLALPQVIYLKQGAKEAPYSLFHWGYTIDDPTFVNVTYYLLFTFGLKWLLIIAALIWGTALQRKVMAALTSLLLLAFCFQFSEEVLANHKFLNMWLIGANIYAGYGLLRLWQLKIGPLFLPSRIAAVALVILIMIGGVIDLVVIMNT